MNIRPAQFTDMPDIMGIFDHARKFMRENGNPYQWIDGYPSEELMETEIRQGHCFVCENETDGVVATFCFSVGNDPTYSHIEGKWLNEAPYGVIHRLASNGKAKGIAWQCIAWCFARHHNLRADTHADNLIMQNLLKTNGFRECGIIYTRQSPRIAYQKVTDAAPSGFQA
ncbi:GNAT family N-acetyltransferase [Paraprevotella clara]|uniref:GNAT family N-acetyltransferase n=1 Tax=Paraprevotella clara TaxID=454154 RepID=UPI0026761ACD|nr:GNAT family N-acetyltransferase [Paraprevotella clara]